MKNKDYNINFERELFFAQYNPSSNKFRLVFKNAGTQALFQNIVRSRKWKELATYCKTDNIPQSIYLHIKGCWHLTHRDKPSIEELKEIIDIVEKVISTRAYKKGGDDE